MKILYAASNNYGSKIQLSRFLRELNGEHQIKIAAYKLSSPKHISIDWTLDALLNIYKPELLSLDNDNLEIYFSQIKKFAPDLIISDLEYFTSYLAGLTNIPLWQCSSSLINFAISKNDRYDLGLFKYYAHSLNRDPQHTQRMQNIIENSERNLVYSHYGDTEKAPILQNAFEWTRPYHRVHKLHVPCQHFAVAGLYKSNKQILDILKKYPDSVVFTDNPTEKYENLYVKDIGSEDEYYCNLRNCAHFVCQGQASLLADAFYNQKFSIIYPDYEDTDSLINSQLSIKLGLGETPHYGIDISNYCKVPELSYDNSINYLHQKIEEIS